MKQVNSSTIISIGLAIFSMLFGAGNLMYPIKVGIESGSYTFFGMLGFLTTSVCLPILGLISMILFDGDYQAFFLRIGRIPGNMLLGICMFIIGPGLVIPRIVTLSHLMTAPFLPFSFLQTITPISSFIFSILFLGITFLATYKESKIIDLLGKIVSPLLLTSLCVIIVKGFLSAKEIVPTHATPLHLFSNNFIRGYETLDLLGAIFFASIVISLLKNSLASKKDAHVLSQHELAFIGLKSGIIGVFLLSIVYIGMAVLGMYHGHGLFHLNEGQLFSKVSFVVLGSHGAFIIGTAVFMACFSTSIALSAVFAEYAQKTLFSNTISYSLALFASLVASIPLSIFGLDKILALTGGPIVYIGYPVLITLTICNLLYKTIGMSYIKIPILITFIGAFVVYFI